MSLSDVASQGNRLKTLEALRDYYARRLDNARGDVGAAALGLRLQHVLDQIAEIGAAAPQVVPEGVLSLDSIRNRRADGATPGPVDDGPISGLGTKSAPRRQGGRRPRKVAE